MEHKLTFKQSAFCREYISNKGNATQAYLATYGTTDYSTASTESSLLLQRDDIQAEIKRLTEPDTEKQKSERERIKDTLWAIINNADEKTENRCRAMDILNRMNAEYIQRTKDESEPNTFDTMALDALKSLLST